MIFFETFVTATNQYANQIRQTSHTTQKIDDTWFSVDNNEIRRYFALTILMSQVKKPRIK